MTDLSQRLANLSPQQWKLLQQRLQSRSSTPEPIAIVGMACRFPGAPDLGAYWQLIEQGIDATSEIPADRWDVDALYDPTGEQAGKMSVRRAGLLENIDQFDPQFFGISPREAARMDPQQRLLLEVCWEALENGGIAPHSVAGSAAGVFVGIGGTDYAKVPAQFEGYYQLIDAHVGTGNALSIAANRISYIFDLRGPSLAVDTACSSSTMAIHLAVQSLRNRECSMALSGGVNAILTPETTIAFSKARMLSPEGRCRPFDVGANGYVRGEGCGILVLKRLSDALEQGDRVFAVIRATATNQDGRTSGITAPNAVSQQTVILAALAQAGLQPSDIQYVEAHGTGTPLGDPIEIEALSRVFPRSSTSERPVYVTSVKANVGHMETVSGVAGIIKVALMMQNQTIAPQLHLEKLNPRISLAQSRLAIPTQAVPWLATDSERLAGVSSFGFGGANTHVVLQAPAGTVADPSSDTSSPIDRTRHLVTLSGKSPAALLDSAKRLRTTLEQQPSLNIADLAATLSRGRTHFAHRAAIVTASTEQLAEQLALLTAEPQAKLPLRGMKSGVVRPGQRAKIAFLFTGQGSQYPDMGLGLYQTQPFFRQALDQCDEILRDLLPRPLLSVIYPRLHSISEPADNELNQTQYTQPALFAIEYALATLWRNWGVEPGAVLGHSVGEYVAACIAGVLSLEDALRLIAHRARLMQELPAGGQIAAVFAPADRAASLIEQLNLGDVLAIAANNGPENTVVSGKASALDAFLQQCDQLGITAQLLRVSHAFHSQLMEPMLNEFHKLASACNFQPPQIPLISNVTGNLQQEPWTADYLCQHVRGTVRFAEGMATLAGRSPDIYLEVGPAPVLTGMGRRCLSDTGAAWLPSLRQGQSDEETLLLTAAELHVSGVPLDWAAFDGPWKRQRLVLPTYPFERQRCWFDPPTAPPRGMAERARRSTQVHPLLGESISLATDQRLFEQRLSPESPAYLSEHRVQDSVAFPAAGYVELALAAAGHLFGPGVHRLDELLIQQALFLPAQSDRVVQTILAAESGGSRTVEISSTSSPSDNQSTWTLHAYGKLRHGSDSADGDAGIPDTYRTFASRVVDVQTQQQFYETMAGRKLQYGQRFRALGQLSRSPDEALGEVQLDATVASELDQYHLHPALGDAVFQTCAGLVPAEPDGGYSPFTYMPTQVRSVRVLRRPQGRLWTYGRRWEGDAQPSPEQVTGDVWLINEADEVVAQFLGVQLTRVGQMSAATNSLTDALYRIQWEPADESVESAAVTDQRWLIFADDSGLANALVGRLKATGGVPVVVRPGETFQTAVAHNGDAGGYLINPSEPSDFEQLFTALERSDSPLAGVVHLWSLLGEREELSAASISQNVSLGSESALRLVQRLIRSAAVSRSQPNSWQGVWWVTRGAQKICGEDRDIRLGQAPLWGLGRVAAVEHPELRNRLIDLDPQSLPEDAATDLFEEIQRRSSEDQIAYRNGQRHVARLQRDPQAFLGHETASSNHSLPAAPFRLRFASTGSFDSLYFESCQRSAPRGNEVEVQVAAAGLNFSDVLKAMGLYPGITDPVVPLGIECAGIVTAVGPEVHGFAVGDRVYGVAPFSFGSHARTADYALSHTPAGMSDAEAATVPIAFMTAYYALVQLADLQPGERVLIHAGAGGVGLAAIQIAQHFGAEVFATAGSDEKRDFLQSLGVKHVFSSRSLDFAEQILQVTNREGIDVVLNSLPGDVISKSLGILRAYGRFLEIGKTDIYQNRLLGLSPFQDNLSYFAIDLDRILRQRPQVIRKLFASLEKHFSSGDFRPLVSTEFAADQVADAFRYMAQRKNIGKVVVGFPQDIAAEDSPSTSDSRTQSDSTVLITGGLGALGIALAEQLVEQGAKHIALLARRDPNEQQSAIVARLCERSHVAVVVGDVSQMQSLQSALRRISDEFPPITDVYHAAGVLDDGLLFDMSASRWQRPLAPKVQGTWNLHTATLNQPVQRFVLFSSIAALLGSPGQANYAAANAFLDAFATYRQSLGFPATSINWGPWADAGMATQGGTAEQMRSRGLGLLNTTDALHVMQRLVESAADNVAVMEVDWTVMLRAAQVTSPLLSAFAVESAELEHKTDDLVDHDFRERIRAATSEQRDELLQRYFTAELARIMGWDAEQISSQQPLSELGMDSLMAMELKNNLERRLAIAIPMSAFIESPSISSLARHAAGEFTRGDAETNPTPSGEHYRVLVPLKSSGTRPAWFCIHPLGGNAGCYGDLAKHAAPDQPVIGVWGRGADGVLEPPRSLDAMIEEYVAAITEHQAEGPYHLIGWSAGGVYAYEIARRLRQAGQPVAPLVLLDTPLPSIYDNIDLNDDARFLYDFTHFSNLFLHARMQVTYEQLQELSREEALQLLLSEAKREGLLAAGASTRYVERLVETSRAHVEFIKNYALEDFGHEIHLYRPAVTGVLEGISGKSWGDDLGWNAVLRRPVSLCQTRGDHFTMLLAESAAELVRQLTRRGDRHDSRAAAPRVGEGLPV